MVLTALRAVLAAKARLAACSVLAIAVLGWLSLPALGLANLLYGSALGVSGGLVVSSLGFPPPASPVSGIEVERGIAGVGNTAVEYHRVAPALAGGKVDVSRSSSAGSVASSRVLTGEEPARTLDDLVARVRGAAPGRYAVVRGPAEAPETLLKAVGAEPRGLEAFNITVYPLWLKLRQAQADGASFTFTFESTAPEPVSLREVAAQLECTACSLENVSLEISAGGLSLHTPVEAPGGGPRVAAAGSLDLTLSEGQQVVVTARYTPVAGAAALAAGRLNVTCTLTLDGYRVPSLAQYQVSTSLAAEVRGRGALLEVAARIVIEGNESLELKLDEHDPLLLCVDGARIESAALEGSESFTASTHGSCAAVAGRGAPPLALNLTLKVAVSRQNTVIAVLPVSLRAGGTTLASKELRAEAGKAVALQRLYGLPYVYVVATPEPLNATVTLRVEGEAREVQLVNGRATVLLPEAFWPILTPLRLEAEKVAVNNPPAVFYAVQDQEEVVIPGLATLATLTAAATAAALALRRRRKPRIEDYIEEFTLE